jgi:hypothetical protein
VAAGGGKTVLTGAGDHCFVVLKSMQLRLLHGEWKTARGKIDGYTVKQLAVMSGVTARTLHFLR